MFNSLPEMLEKQSSSLGNRPIFGTKVAGEWQWITYREFGDMVADFRAGLAKMGVGQGDHVGIIARNSVEWATAAYATYGLGGVFVPMYETQAPEDCSYIIDNAKLKVLIVQDIKIAQKLPGVMDKVSDPDAELNYVISVSNDGDKTFKSVLAEGKENPIGLADLKPNQLMGLIYTSGTTGNPKGVMLSHYNILSNCKGASERFNFTPNDRTLCFLPWAHIFGQVGDLHLLIYNGYSTAFAESVTSIVPNLAEISPTFIMAVPKIFNRIYEGVNQKIQKKGKLIETLVAKALEANTKKHAGKSVGVLEQISSFLMDRMVFSKIRQSMGGKLAFAISGGAALDSEVATFIQNIGINLYEGYGLSETSPIISCNAKGMTKIGSVGRVLPGVKVELDQSIDGLKEGEGEIVASGSNVMQGYFGLDQATKEVITGSGGFRTGDIGFFDKDGFLHITGRIKEQFKLLNGKYVAPAPIEEKLKLSPYIENALVYGDNKPFNTCLIVLNKENLNAYAAEENISVSNGDYKDNPQIKSLIQSEVDHHLEAIKSYEKPRKIFLVSDEWLPENGLLTPTLKVKRRKVVEKYQSEIEGLYA